MNKKIILQKEQIDHITRRIAYQIYETFVGDKEIIIVGIVKSGYVFAKKIAEILQEISDITVILGEIEVNKQNPIDIVHTNLSEDQYAGKSIVLVDDVMNSGATLIYGVRHFLNTPIKKLKTAVLVNRNHKKYPVKADFKGISLSTSRFEHIEVVFNEDDAFAFLTN